MDRRERLQGIAEKLPKAAVARLVMPKAAAGPVPADRMARRPIVAHPDASLKKQR
jgi:hypothetical protein